MNTATECPAFPGYYEIPGFSRYAVTLTGAVLNKETCTVLQGSVNPDGYHNFRLRGDDGHTLTLGRHRLLGIVFKHPGVDITDLVINHVKGVKGEDDLTGLEWTTYQGNAEHAGAMGLSEKCVPIEVRDVDTGIVIKYPSFIECGRALGLTKDAVSYRIKAGAARVFPEHKQYRIGHTDTPWPVPENIERAVMANGLSKAVAVRNVKTGKVTVYKQLSKLAEDLGVSQATITLWLNQSDQPVLPKLIQIKLFLDPTPWRAITDPYLELEAYTKQRVIKTVHVDSGKVTYYHSAKECAEHRGLKPTTLNYRLKSGQGHTYPDGYQYWYYSDTVHLPKGPVIQ